MLEIMIIGYGGQGSVVAAKLLGDAAVKAGYNSQSFSSYGAERRGGRVESYIRLDYGEILVHSKMYEPDYLVLMDRELAKDPLKMPHLKKGIKVLVNTNEPADIYAALKDCQVTTIDANRIAAFHGLTLPSGMVIINTAMLGAIGGLIPLIEKEHLSEAIQEGKIPKANKNIDAALEAYERVKGYTEETLATKPIERIVAERYPAYLNRTPPCEVACPAGESIGIPGCNCRSGN